MNFLPFALVDPGPAESRSGFGAGAGAGAQLGASGAGDDAVGELTFPEVGDFDVRFVHGYGKVANVESGMVFLEDRARILQWKIWRGVSLRPLGAKTGIGTGRDAPSKFDGEIVLHSLGETKEGVRGESLPCFLPLHPAAQLAHAGPPVHREEDPAWPPTQGDGKGGACAQRHSGWANGGAAAATFGE